MSGDDYDYTEPFPLPAPVPRRDREDIGTARQRPPMPIAEAVRKHMEFEEDRTTTREALGRAAFEAFWPEALRDSWTSMPRDQRDAWCRAAQRVLERAFNALGGHGR